MTKKENNLIAARTYRGKQKVMWDGVISDLKSCNMLPEWPKDTVETIKLRKYMEKFDEPMCKKDRNMISARIYRARRDAFREECMKIWRSFMDVEM
jgi:hypothetical protein